MHWWRIVSDCWDLHMLKRITQYCIKLFLKRAKKEALQEMINEANTQNIIDVNEHSMIRGCLTVSSLKVRDLMVPRYRAVCIDQNNNIEEVLSVVTDSQHSRFPILADEHTVTGVLLAKRLINLINVDTTKIDLSQFTHPVHIVPESKRIDGLLTELKSRRSHMAIAVDEYNNFSGIITIEDILEEIVGDIEDEDYEPLSNKMIKQIHPDHYIINGITTIENINQVIAVTLKENKHYDTLGGFLLYHFGYIPSVGETLSLNGIDFKILNADGRRIRLVDVKLNPHEASV